MIERANRGGGRGGGGGEEMEEEGKRHFILVHGTCHGGWCWYKLATLLRAAGHRVTAPDLAACGVNPKRLDEVRSFSDYCQPLVEAISSIPSGERVVLVGHSSGGFAVAMAAEKFAEKISAAIFVAAIMPSTTTSLPAITEEFTVRHPPDYFMDTKFMISPGPEINRRTLIFGPNYMKERLYQLCAPEDLMLATMLVRPWAWLENDALVVSKESYGSVSRVFVVCKEDPAIFDDFQRWMIEQSPEVEVKEIEEAGHMVMLSNPKELCSILLEIAGKYQ